jgi:hypothetical protein
MYSFLSGALMMGCWVAGLFFLKFQLESRDFLFKAFGLAFWLLGLERAMIILLGIEHEKNVGIYLIRLAAFILILYAILRKNLSEKRSARSKM